MTAARKAPAKKAGTRKVKAGDRVEVPPATAPAPHVASPRQESDEEILARWRAWKDQPGAIDEVCDWIAGGGSERSLSAWVRAKGFRWHTVWWWIKASQERLEAYDRACDTRATVMFERVLEVASEEPERTAAGSVDPGSVADKRLRVDTLKWAAGRLAPKRFGDKLQLGGADDLPPMRQEVAATLTPSEAYMRMLGKA